MVQIEEKTDRGLNDAKLLIELENKQKMKLNRNNLVYRASKLIHHFKANNFGGFPDVLYIGDY